MTYTITKNEKFNSIEIQFDSKPSETVRNALKKLKFRWLKPRGIWYGYTDAETAENAIKNADTDDALIIPGSKEVDPGTLYAGWEGGNNHKWRDDKELKSCLLSDFRKAGIKATIRFNRAGHLTSITATMTIYADEIKSFDEWVGDNDFYNLTRGWGWLSWTDEDGHHDIFAERFYYDISDDERERLKPLILQHVYKCHVDRLTTSDTKDETILKDSARTRFDLLKTIVASYNRDCSNAMIDYFDRAIYDNYSFKIVER